jgi:septum formation protein
VHDAAPLILASSSPRRVALLRQVGVVPDAIAAPAVDETPLAKELPQAYVLRMAGAKLEDVAARPAAAGAYVLAADTGVACGRRLLGKADDVEAAERCLRLLSGRRHRVHTGVAIAAPDGRRAARVVMTVVRFRRLHESEIAAYLACGEWRGKAGGYAIQGRAEAFIPAINGSYSNVVGLPLAATLDLLRGLGWRPQR